MPQSSIHENMFCQSFEKLLIAKPNTIFVSLLPLNSRRAGGGLSLCGGDLVLLHSRPRTVGMPTSPTTPPPNLFSMRGPTTNLLFSAIASLLLLLLTPEVAAKREGRILSNPFGLLGHPTCSSTDDNGNAQQV